MDTLTWTKTDLPVTDEQITELEKVLPFHIPDELKYLFIKANGGQPSKKIVRLENRRYALHFDTLLNIKHGCVESLDDIYKYLKLVLPPWLIPFAYDPFGNYYCISDKAHGFSIYFYTKSDHLCSMLTPNLKTLISSLEYAKQKP